MNKKFAQRGDTLVEVLMALAVIGIVLGLAYATSSRSTRVGRLAQERTEALKMAESQVEIAKTKSSVEGSAWLSAVPTTDFCLVGSGSSKVASSDAQCLSGLYRITNNYNSTDKILNVKINWQQQGGAATAEANPEVSIYYKLY